jgi:uncharacterized membrane protein YfcA
MDVGADVDTVLVVMAVVLVAGTSQTVAGFGFALIAVPCFVAVLDVRDAVALTSLLAVVNSGVLARTAWRHVPWATIGPMLAGAVAGMPLGLAVLLFAPEDAIRLAVAGSTIVLAAALALGLRIGDRHTPSEVGVGIVAGVLSTSTGTNGPPVVLYLQGREHPPLEFRAGLAAFFTVSGLVSLAAFAGTGVVTRDALVLAAYSLPVVAVGSALGHWLAPRIEPAVFRLIVFALLILSATVAATTAIVRIAS